LNRHNIKNLPCHRVVRKNGFVGGYRLGEEEKIKRLKAEGVKILKTGKILDLKSKNRISR